MAEIKPEPSFDAVFKRELDRIVVSRYGRKDIRITSDPQTNLTGLAFSEGGTRSATFCMGVLQGLARTGLLRGIDYISCVGGGGYAGGWLTSAIANQKFAAANLLLRDMQV